MKSEITRIVFTAITSLSLLGCHFQGTYQSFLGGMLISDFQEYEPIVGKEIHQDFLSENNSSYYINLYFLNDGEELTHFYSHEGTSCPQSEREFCQDRIETNAILYACTQIPEGYRAFKKNDIQFDKDGKKVLVTPSFYYYNSKPGIYFLNIDLTVDPLASLSNFSFFYVLDSDYKEVLSYDNIRILYQLNR